MNVMPVPVQMPSICFICEQGNNASLSWVDTGRSFDVGVQTFLTGRKYVCSECAEGIAMAVGFHAPEEHEALAAQVLRLDHDLGQLEQRAKDGDALLAILGRAQALVQE